MTKMTVWGVGPRIMAPSYCLLIFSALIPVKINIIETLHAPRLYINIASLVFICAGIILLIVADKDIKQGLQTKQLITTGLFSWLRNPMYMAHIVFLIPGICLLTNNAITAVSILCAVILFYIFIPREEKFLEENFGSEYRKYKNKVNRLVPKIFN